MENKKGCIVTFGVLFILLALSAFPFFSNLDSHQQPTVVKVMAEGEYWGSWQGTGVFIADDLIMTAGHVVNDANSITIVWSDGTQSDANSWYYESDADLGIVRVSTPEKEREAKFDDAIVGEDVWSFGNPFGVFPVLTKGIVSAIGMFDDYSHQKDMIITDCAINPGNSGGPLFDGDNNILGICSWQYTYAQGMSYFVRAEVCELVINKYYTIKALKDVD